MPHYVSVIFECPPRAKNTFTLKSGKLRSIALIYVDITDFRVLHHGVKPPSIGNRIIDSANNF